MLGVAGRARVAEKVQAWRAQCTEECGTCLIGIIQIAAAGKAGLLLVIPSWSFDDKTALVLA
ncbi:hypothetical protein CS344_24615 [Bordetella bronchiseptica]|nr:hypothetical protein CS344_24615 [Bordetella bronchiseptica]QBS71593.1 hypothetical protein B2C13_24310 [Bordetella bronchiseptica]